MSRVEPEPGCKLEEQGSGHQEHLGGGVELLLRAPRVRRRCACWCVRLRGPEALAKSGNRKWSRGEGLI